MAIFVKDRVKLVKKVISKPVKLAHDIVMDWKYDKNRIKQLKNQVLQVNAKRLGLKFRLNLENEIRTQLCHQLIREVRDRRLRYIDITHVTGVPRPKVTAILNGNTKELTIDLLVRILAAVGTTTQFFFIPNK